MNRALLILFIGAQVILCSHRSQAQAGLTITRNGLTLEFTNLDPTFDPALTTRMIETFFQVYPILKKEYNEAAATTVRFVIDTAYKGVAATGGGRIVYSPAYFKSQPGDIDVVTHELMHVVQDYGGGRRRKGGQGGPGWLTEGIADYVRYKFGIDNAGAGWTLPDFKESQSYTNSYRITARFLAWIENQDNRDLVKKLDSSLRGGTYTDRIWKKETGKTLDELWMAYSKNPAL